MDLLKTIPCPRERFGWFFHLNQQPMNYKPIKINFIPMFYRLNKNGKCVIKCRLRHNDEKIEFPTGIFIIPESWNRKNQNVHPPNQENDFINSELSLIKNKLNQAFFY